MKELESHLNEGVKTELNVKKQQEVEYILKGRLCPKNGHFVWELNEETGEIKKAQYKKDTAAFNSLAEKEPESLIKNPDCIYIPALNAENAQRKYLKNKEQEFYYVKPSPANINDITY